MDIFELDGNLIRKLRDAAGMTRDKLCEITEVPKRTLEDIESGESKNPSLEVFKKLLKAFPEYTGRSSRDELLGRVFVIASTLNESELGRVSRFISNLSSRSSTSTKGDAG